MCRCEYDSQYHSFAVNCVLYSLDIVNRGDGCRVILRSGRAASAVGANQDPPRARVPKAETCTKNGTSRPTESRARERRASSVPPGPLEAGPSRRPQKLSNVLLSVSQGRHGHHQHGGRPHRRRGRDRWPLAGHRHFSPEAVGIASAASAASSSSPAASSGMPALSSIRTAAADVASTAAADFDGMAAASN